jgi:hypothetical protein
MNEQVYSGFLYIMYMCIFLGFISDLEPSSYLLSLFLLDAFCLIGAETAWRYTFNAPLSEDSTSSQLPRVGISLLYGTIIHIYLLLSFSF